MKVTAQFTIHFAMLAAFASADVPRYDRDIRPILSDRCFKCHGPDPASRQAKLRLDERTGAVSDSAERPGVIVPGKSDDSELWKRISTHDSQSIMPPADSSKRPLSTEEKSLIKRWIDAGAEYEPHWSFLIPTRPPLPSDQQLPAENGWRENPIDRFVGARLAAEKVSPSEPAPRETIIRRVFLDLTGLPPTPAEIDAFLADSGDDAVGRLVEKLMTEEPYRTRYAERMATNWLDAARYADTCGIHTDAGRQMWAYRDWVLNAYRANMPFDRFAIEQLAGDLLADATDEQKIASGFNRCHVTSDEGGAIPEELLVEYAVERTSTLGSVFLGLTVGCVRCHEHKFDPIAHDEFYKLYAFFNSVEEPGLYSQLPDSNRAFEPFMQVPTPEQRKLVADLKQQIETAKAEIEKTSPEETAQRDAFMKSLPSRAGVAWAQTQFVSARSTGGATLAAQPDGSVLASGENPARDDHIITLRTDATALRLVSLEALTDSSLPQQRVGRSPNGNAVLSGVIAEAVSIRDPSQKVPVKFGWAWADFEQANGDFRVLNILDENELGWAVDAHNRTDSRVALLLADKPFGFEGGTELRFTLQYRSVYAQHTFGRVRLGVGTINAAGEDLLPAAVSGWYVVGPFPIDLTKKPYEQTFDPEREKALDLKKNFGNGNQMWRFVENYLDDIPNVLPDGTNISYVARRILAPTARKIEVSLGSDDGFSLQLNGREIAGKQVERGVLPDQDKAALELVAGENLLIFKIINTGGQAGFFYRSLRRAEELSGQLAAALLPETSRRPELNTRMQQDWKFAFSPGYREKKSALASIERKLVETDAQIPKSMVMKELPKPRETFVLTRGQYDKPDKNRPVARGLPAILGKLPPDAPQDRLGLARWLVSPENPLTARVIVNRLWEQMFGTGIVRTTEDLGMQSDWPSHPELLDWLAVEFRESGWNTQHILRLIATSRTYQQSSRVRLELRERDPDNRLLAYFPRRRLPAETIRDQALYVSGLLVEKLGGPSVKPYQPEGLWQEISMPASNTRIYERDAGEALWRRSLYTYWKRACPPPAMANLDVPTREACVVRRLTTNTPLQALTLWNDEQFVEASRVFAERALAQPGDDRARLVWLYRSATARAPEAVEIARLTQVLAEFRERYAKAKEDAAKLLSVGAKKPNPELAPAELAAWTMLASALLNLNAAICQS